MNGSYKEYRPNRFYVRFYWKGKQWKVYNFNGEMLDTERRASRLLERIRSEIDGDKKGSSFDPSKYTNVKRNYIFKNIWEKYIEEKKGEHKRVLKSYFNNHFRRFHSTDIRDIRSFTIKEWCSEIKTSPRNIIVALRAFLNWCNKWYDLKLELNYPEVHAPQPRQKYLESEQQETILSFVPDFYKPAIKLCMWYGLRPIEVRGLMWSDISGDIITIHRSKTAEKGIAITRIKMDERVIELLSSMPRAIGNEYIFQRKGGGQLERCILTKIWIEARNKAGIDACLYEGTRHSWASQALNNGIDMALIQKVLGHTSTKITQQYAKASPVTLGKVLVHTRDIKKSEGK